MKRIIFLAFFMLLTLGLSASTCHAGDLDNFLKIVKPELEKIFRDSSRFQKDIAITGENYLDTLTFAYRLAIRKVEYKTKKVMHHGDWSLDIKEEVMDFLSILCTIGDLIGVRKNVTYKNMMIKFRPMLVQGAYRQMIQELTVSSRAYEITRERLTLGPELRDVKEVLNITGIQIISDLQGR